MILLSITQIKYIFHVKFLLFVTSKSDRDLYPEPHGMRIGLAFRIRIQIRVEVKAGSTTLPSTGNCQQSTGTHIYYIDPIYLRGKKFALFVFFSGVKGLDPQTCDFFIYQNMLLYIPY